MECVIEKDISPKTIDRIVSIARDYTRDYFTENFPDDMRADMGFQRAIYLTENGELVSCIVFTCLDGSPHITMMATKRPYSGKGYGRLLMRHFVAHVSSLGFRCVELLTFSPETRPLYAATIGFYKSMGFETVREYEDLWEPGTKTVKMRKRWTDLTDEAGRTPTVLPSSSSCSYG